MAQSHAIRFGLFSIAMLAVAACGGSGSGSSASPSTVTATASAGSQLATTAVAKQHIAAGSALQAASASIDINQFGAADGALISAINEARTATAGNSSSSGVTSCNHGAEFAFSSTSSDSAVVTIDYFYDPQCSVQYKTLVLDITFSGTGGAASGSEQVYTPSGATIDYQTYDISFVDASSGNQLASITVAKTIAAQPSASPYASVGYSCNFGNDRATDCGNGNTIALPSASPSPFSIGFEDTTVGSIVTPSPSASPTTAASGAPSGSPSSGPWIPSGNQGAQAQVQLQINGAGYTGSLGGLTLAAATTPAWTIGGGQEVTTLTGTVTSSFGGQGMGGNCGSGAMSSISLTITDTADGLVATLSSSGAKLTGTVTSSGTTVATISLDRSGSGSISFTNGTTSAVKDWVILT